MPVALKALVAALAFGPLAVHGLFEHVSFSPIEQCGPFNVSFNGGVAPDALPLRLTIIPFNASPISIVLPTESWNATSATGAAITFLPLAANTTFLASLNDANGNPTGVNTSDIIQVQPSDNSFCLSASIPAFTPLYTVSQPRQCEIFNVSYDSSIVTAPPTARVYAPLAPTFTLDNKAFQNGSSTYLMNVTRGTQVAIMFNDNAGHNQTSVPLTVFGDTSSSSACLSTLDVAPAPLGSASDTNGGLPRLAIVIIVVCTIAIVGTISLMSVIFVVRERRRRRTTRLRNAFFPRGDPEKINPYVEPAPSAPLPTYLPEPREARLLTGQPYGAVSPRSEMFGGRISTAPVTPKSPKSGMSDKSGFSQAIYALPSPPPPPTLSRPMPRNAVGRSASLASVNARTIASLDIEQMLEQATTSPGPASAAFNAPGLPSSAGHIMPSQQLSRTPTQVPSPLPSALRISPVSSKRDAQELDVPSSATPSGQFSDYSPIQAMSPESRYRVAPFLDPPPFSANSRRNQPPSPYSR